MRALLISFIAAAPDVLVGPGFWCGMWLWCYVAGVRMSTSHVGHLCVLRYRLINAVKRAQGWWLVGLVVMLLGLDAGSGDFLYVYVPCCVFLMALCLMSVTDGLYDGVSLCDPSVGESV
jgi:hypothetical protein